MPTSEDMHNSIPADSEAGKLMLEQMKKLQTEARKPSIGRIVIYHFSQDELPLNNQQESAPAVITAVWSDDCVNLKVLCDSPEVLWRTSVVRGDEGYCWSWPELK